MGMYTEIYICSEIKKNTPDDVITILRSLFDHSEEIDLSPVTLPDHPFFKCDRWDMIGHCCSYYHIPFPTSVMKYDDIGECWYVVSRSDLKNYDGEIENFFNWVMPYLDKYGEEFIGYSRYEEDFEPVLYYKKGEYNYFPK